MIHIWRAWWAIRDTWRGYDAGDIASLRMRVVSAQMGPPGEVTWLSPEETRALGAGEARGIGRGTSVLLVDGGRALIQARIDANLAPIRRA